MRLAATVLVALGLMALSTPSFAYWTSDLTNSVAAHASKRHWDRPATYEAKTVRRFAARSNDTIHDSAYWLAVQQGGPCGLTAEREIFGRSDHVLNGWNPWLAHDWKGFPETSPAVGMVAVWRDDSHVEVIHNLNGNGIFNRGRNLALVIVVDPHGDHRNVGYAYRPHHARHRRYAGV